MGKNTIAKEKRNEMKKMNLQLIQWQDIQIEIVCCALHGQTSKKVYCEQAIIEIFPKKSVRLGDCLMAGRPAR